MQRNGEAENQRTVVLPKTRVSKGHRVSSRVAERVKAVKAKAKEKAKAGKAKERVKAKARTIMEFVTQTTLATTRRAFQLAGNVALYDSIMRGTRIVGIYFVTKYPHLVTISRSGDRITNPREDRTLHLGAIVIIP